MSKRIIITIDKVGRPTIEADGYVGTSCQTATKGYEDLFAAGGAKPEDVRIEEKEEMHMIDTNKEQIQQQNDW